MKGFEVIAELKNHLSENDLIVSSNGNISRETYNLLPKPQVYLRGAMGLPVAVGLGLALANPKNRVTVITGDGNLLMGLGSSTTAAYYKPKNLKILILDNFQYYTTGGQKTVSSTINYSKFLESLNIGYFCSKKAFREEIRGDLAKFLNSDTFSVLHLTIKESKMDVENIPWHPEEITRRFITKLTN